MRCGIVALGLGAVVSVVATLASAAEGEKAIANPVVVIKTSEGTIKVELWADKAPLTVKNFLRYTDEKFFDGTVFHRVISNFMIQGGGMTADMRRKETHEPIKNEAKADLKNNRGTIAMARTNELHSATSQFFINVKDNPGLDHRGETEDDFGYCVFGKVTEGMDVVDKIRAVKTGAMAGHRDVPLKPVTIESIRREAKE
ncbi:MAG: peptidyl-prolyl cis-trans isomerase [Planctomycetes bacterium]|nr:peptidyl-prolyl cis-trans isomerase [Planctomycetota bacterium]